MGNFAFFMFLRLNRPMLLDGFREWLGAHSMTDLKTMVDSNQVPPFQSDWVYNCIQFKAGIADITMAMWFEFIAEANPELGDYINSKGVDGGRYLAMLRERFLYLLEHPEEAKAVELPAAPADPIVNLHCDKCGKSWPVRKSKVEDVAECPFCHAGAKA
jgi:hypothetical protein